MSQVIGGYEDNGVSKASGRKEVTVTTHQDKSMLDVTILKQYGTNHYEKVDATTEYVGKENNTGVWLILKIVTDGEDKTLTYATIKNNSSVATYSAAWTNRATITYALYSVAF